jgi:hypothetical protein
MRRRDERDVARKVWGCLTKATTTSSSSAHEALAGSLRGVLEGVDAMVAVRALRIPLVHGERGRRLARGTFSHLLSAPSVYLLPLPWSAPQHSKLRNVELPKGDQSL